MNKRLIILLTAVVSIASIFAQDSRQRSNSTIIADALAQLPAQDEASFAAAMADIANTGSQGIVELADMLVPADKGKNATIEYAINGIVNYVCRDGHDAERAMVRKGLADAIARCSDNPNRAFLFSQLSLCATADDASLIAGYLSDDYLADWAVRALAAMQGIDGLVLDLIRNEAAPRSSLAYLAYEKRLSEAEPILLGWLDGADAVTANAIYNALGVCGSKASIKALGSAAAAHMYVQDASEATQSYVALLNNIAAGPDAKKAVKKRNDTPAAPAVHTVKSGENLSAIADKYGVSVANLREWNDLKSDNIRVGDKLKLKADGKTSTSSRSRDNEAAEQTHKVKKGETLGQIATKYGVTVDDLRKWNNIKGNNIAAGQNLKVYSDKKVDRKTDKTDKKSKKKQKTHKVKRGETLGEIAEKYGVGLSKLKKANGIKGNNIQIGQSLKIPQ